AIIGVYPTERICKQSIELDLEMQVDTQTSILTDDIQNTVNYDTVIAKLEEWIEYSHFHLIEALAHYLADNLLSAFPLINQLRLQLSKFPDTVPARCVGVTVHKKRDSL